MSKIVELAAARQERQAHICGPAHCIGCGHTWEAVVPAQAHREKMASHDPWLECTACHAFKGLFTYTFAPAEAEVFWACNCGCDAFGVSEQGVFCHNCGAWQHSLTVKMP
jgi:hypothetical protein